MNECVCDGKRVGCECVECGPNTLHVTIVYNKHLYLFYLLFIIETIFNRQKVNKLH